MRPHLLTDADNTLWDTDAVFARAQLGLLQDVSLQGSLPYEQTESLAYVRSHDQLIATAHPDGLRYPAMLLAQALDADLRIGSGNERLSAAVSTYMKHLQTVPALRPGVAEALPMLAEMYGPLVVVTEASERRCRTLLGHYGFDAHVSKIVSGPKSVELYRTLMHPRSRNVMVGDQLDRDVAYASAAGFETVLYPGAFEPSWTRGVASVADHVVGDYRDLIDVLGSLRRRSIPA